MSLSATMATSAQSTRSTASSPIVLVTAPRCVREESDGAIQVERERCHSIDLSHSPLPERPLRTLPPPSPRNESSFGALEDDKDRSYQNGHPQIQELQDRNAIAHIIAPDGSQEVELGDFDACQEYGYKYAYTCDDQEEDDDDDDEIESSSCRPPSSHIPEDALVLPFDVSTATAQLNDTGDCPYTVYLLGKSYHPIDDYAIRRNDETSLFWFTYRSDFPEIAPYRITTDAGWGCMLRSAQMLLGQTLRLHFQSREWRPPQSIAKRKVDPFIRRILTWFADFPSQSECVFSLHNMVAAGLARYETLPGEWYGPGTACYVIRDLCNMYEQRQKDMVDCDGISSANQSNPRRGDLNRPMFRVYVASQGSIFRDAVQELMTRDTQQKQTKEANNGINGSKEVAEQEPHPLSHPLDPQYTANTSESAKEIEWDTSLLLLVPLRLGLKNFNEDYALPLAHIFSFAQSVGVLGGRPRGARWFYGSHSDGSKLYGLDPHTIQCAPQKRRVHNIDGTTRTVVGLSDDYVRSVHTTYPEVINLHRMDPSLAIGFYCRDYSDFEDLCSSLESWKQQHKEMPEIFSVADAVPDYSADVSSVMKEMMSSNAFADSDDVGVFDDDGNASEEDEYVML